MTKEPERGTVDALVALSPSALQGEGERCRRREDVGETRGCSPLASSSAPGSRGLRASHTDSVRARRHTLRGSVRGVPAWQSDRQR